MLPRRDALRQHLSIRSTRLWGAWLVGLMGVIGSPVLAQDLPSPSEALGSHQVVRTWVKGWSVPSPVEMEVGTGVGMPAVWGAAVTLRLDGRVLSRGAWISPDGPSPLAVWHAAGSAVRIGRAGLSLPNDALAEEKALAMGGRVTVSLEFFGTPVPIADDELAMPFAGSSPGAEAMVVRVENEVRVVGVDAQLTRGSDPARELAAMAAEITGEGETALKPIADLKEDGFTFSRAPVVHLAMPFEGASPVFLDRGSRRIPVGAVRSATMLSTADLIAAHLRSRVWPGGERYGIGGDLNATTGKIDPIAGEPFAQSLAAIALLRHAESRSKDAAASAEAAVRIVRDLGSVERDEISAWASPLSAAGAIAALRDITPDVRATDAAFEVLRVRCLDTLGNAFDPDAGFAEDLPKGGYGLIAWAHVCAMELDPAFTAERADAAIRRAFRETEPGQLVGQMPFLAWADMELYPEGELPSAVALSAMREQVWAFQLHWRDLRPLDRDLAGGVVFTRSRVPLPTWQSLRPMAALATMIGDERMTPGGIAAGPVPGEIVRMSDGIRFVRQLVMEGDGLFLARNSTQALGGVRRAMWDPTLSPEAGAIALLTVCETMDSMKAVTRRAVDAAREAQQQP
ncbi:MAG: hypothetical protein AB8F26_00040 [Phycisphaerales bacterium]